MTAIGAYALIVLMAALTSYAQLILKWQVATQIQLIPPPHGILFYFKLLLSPWVISSFAAAFAASFCWMAALSRLPISKAYPVSSLTFIAVVIGGAFLFSEVITWQKIAGVVFILIGIIFVSRG